MYSCVGAGQASHPRKIAVVCRSELARNSGGAGETSLQANIEFPTGFLGVFRQVNIEFPWSASNRTFSATVAATNRNR